MYEYEPPPRNYDGLASFGFCVVIFLVWYKIVGDFWMSIPPTFASLIFIGLLMTFWKE